MIVTYGLAYIYISMVVVCIKLIDCIFAYVMQKNKITLIVINILIVFFCIEIWLVCRGILFILLAVGIQYQKLEYKYSIQFIKIKKLNYLSPK
jgi:hypothetical protein